MRSFVDQNAVMARVTVYVFAHSFIRDFWIVPCDLWLILPCTLTVMICYRCTSASRAHGPAAAHRHALPRGQDQAPVHCVGPPSAIGCQMSSWQRQSGKKKQCSLLYQSCRSSVDKSLTHTGQFAGTFCHKICSDFSPSHCVYSKIRGFFKKFPRFFFLTLFIKKFKSKLHHVSI